MKWVIWKRLASQWFRCPTENILFHSIMYSSHSEKWYVKFFSLVNWGHHYFLTLVGCFLPRIFLKDKWRDSNIFTQSYCFSYVLKKKSKAILIQTITGERSPFPGESATHSARVFEGKWTVTLIVGSKEKYSSESGNWNLRRDSLINWCCYLSGFLSLLWKVR